MWEDFPHSTCFAVVPGTEDLASEKQLSGRWLTSALWGSKRLNAGAEPNLSARTHDGCWFSRGNDQQDVTAIEGRQLLLGLPALCPCQLMDQTQARFN